MRAKDWHLPGWGHQSVSNEFLPGKVFGRITRLENWCRLKISSLVKICPVWKRSIRAICKKRNRKLQANKVYGVVMVVIFLIALVKTRLLIGGLHMTSLKTRLKFVHCTLNKLKLTFVPRATLSHFTCGHGRY